MSRNALLVLLATWMVLVVEANVILRDDGEIDLSDLGLELYGEPDKQFGELVDNYDPDKDGVRANENEMQMIEQNGLQSQNVQQGPNNKFFNAKTGTTDGFGVQYDYGSVMHYSANAFSSNGQPTIVAAGSVVVGANENEMQMIEQNGLQSQNVQQGPDNNFFNAKTGTTDGLGVQYDYRSVMHYSPYALSLYMQPTIVAV